jgi:D-alanyl-D-alanine carboxypeptidase
VLVAPGLTLAPGQAAISGRVELPLASPIDAPLALGRADARDGALLQAALDAARAVAGADGATVAIVRHGRAVWDGASGPRAGAGFVIGSVAKTFVAAAILQLVDEGRLDLETAIDGLLPPFRGVSRSITIRQLLDHTSGVADVFNQATSDALERAPARAWSTRQVLGTLGEAWHAPGAGWSYANTNYLLLGLVIERVTGRSLEDELRRRFLAPLGLTATRMLSVDDPAPLTPAWATIFWGSGAMTASAADLARWGDALYAGDVLGDATRAEMLAFNDDGYGLGAQRLDIGGVTGVGHTGLLDTYTSLLLHLPAANVTIALLVDTPRAPLGAMLTAVPPDGGPSLLELATRS